MSFWHGLSITLSHLAPAPDHGPVPGPHAAAGAGHAAAALPRLPRGGHRRSAPAARPASAPAPSAASRSTLEKDPTNPKQRVVTQFDIDEAKCMFCGLCVEPCPTGAIQHTREFEASQRDIRNLVFRWADPLSARSRSTRSTRARSTTRARRSARSSARSSSRVRWDAPGPDVPAARAAEAPCPGRREADAGRATALLPPLRPRPLRLPPTAAPAARDHDLGTAAPAPSRPRPRPK